MTLSALQHLIRSAQALAEDTHLLVLGSASLLASFPDLGNHDAILSATYDADLLPQPFEELTAIMLDEALGEQRAYYRRYGYHADILRASIVDTLPQGWTERTVAIEGTQAHALDPYDLAAVKMLVGRVKDLELVKHLVSSNRLQIDQIQERINLLPIPVEMHPRIQSCLAGLGK